jgi:hypothetical protein
MIQVFHRSEAGGHPVNEDAFDVRPLPHDPGGYLCVVADGQGGRAGGAAAAKRACEACVAASLDRTTDQLLRPRTWSRILQSVDEAVCDDPTAGFTTVVAFCVTKTSLCGASNGDSAAVLLTDRPGQILTARQFKNPPVGSRDATFIPFAADLAPPWAVLAMSDGVWKYAGWESILPISPAMPGEEMLASLRSRTSLRGRGGLQDDFTLVALLARN